VDFDFAVIGAGVVGLATAAELSPRGSLIVLEREEKFGQGTSSRNSEVIHAGLYYAPGSLKAELCIAGREIIEVLAGSGSFAYSQIGKYIVAINEREKELLDGLLNNARACGVTELRWADREELGEKEPGVNAEVALFSPKTGIIDSHGLMNHFRIAALESGADFAYNAPVDELCRITDSSSLSSAKSSAGYEITISDGTVITARRVVNCAGLYADRIASMVGIDTRASRLELHWSRGVYFESDSTGSLNVSHLIYPVPDHKRDTLGVHVCIDLSGHIRFGPTAEYLSHKIEDYRPPWGDIESVAQGLQHYLPLAGEGHLHPVMVGIRPKLSGPGEPVRDFYIREESDRGLPGFVNLIGIESPGLTASPAIARLVGQLLN
jgi:L-2-hydroxyglutarate oxidase LhgO